MTKHPGLKSAQSLSVKSAKLLSRKKNRVNLTPRDVFKPMAVMADVFVYFMRRIGADWRAGRHAAGLLRAHRHTFCCAPIGAFAAKSFDGARIHKWKRSVAYDR